jgi:hypothetical protein
MATSAGLDSWQSLLETCQRLEHELTSDIASNRGSSSSRSQTRWREKVHESLGRFTLAVLSLRQKLNTGVAHLTAGERRRREAVVASIEGRETQLRYTFQQGGFRREHRQDDERRRLLDSSIIDMGTDANWGDQEDASLLPTSSMASYQQQRDQTLEDQDRGLDALHEVIVRQKRLAENIETEVGAQNDLIDDIDQGLERTTHTIINTTQGVRAVGQRDSVWRYWLAIVVLTILIIIVIAIPGSK